MVFLGEYHLKAIMVATDTFHPNIIHDPLSEHPQF